MERGLYSRIMESAAFEVGAMTTWPTKAAWDADAAELVATMLERWHLVAGDAFVGGESASVLRVTTAEGTPAVLKVGFPHPEGIGEALALDAWSPTLSPEVLRQDAWTWSLLLAEVAPGTPLSKQEIPASEALGIAAALHVRLAAVRAPGGIAGLPEVVGVYLESARVRLPGQHDRLAGLGALAALERGLAEADSLVTTDRGGMLLHGDFNPGNILRAGDAGWLVIDPKPMLGDPEYDLWPLISQVGAPFVQPDPARAVAEQLDLVVRRIGCDRERAARWGLARAALNLSWSLEDGARLPAERAAMELAVWVEICGA